MDDIRRRGGLTRKQVTVLALYAGTDLNLREIGRRMGIKDRGNVLHLINRANERLRESGLPEVSRKAKRPRVVKLAHLGQLATPNGNAVQV